MNQFFSSRPVVLAMEGARLYNKAGGAQTAAALSYFLLLSLFPLLLCANYLIGLFHLGLGELLEGLDQFLPAQVLQVLEDYVHFASQNRSQPLFLLALFTIVMSASAGLRALFSAMDRLFGYTPKSMLGRTMLSVLLSLLLLLTIYLSMAVVLTGEWFFRLLELGLPDRLASLIPLSALAALWSWVRYLLLFLFVLLLVLAIYTLGIPRGMVPKQGLRLGALLTAGAMVAASFLFSFFIGLSSRYSLIYGSLASLVILLIWLFFCSNILFLGALVVRLVFPEPGGQ